MRQHSEPEKKPRKKLEEARDATNSGTVGGLGSEATRRLFRYYSPATGKCDLTEEQADERERRREIYNHAVNEERELRRQERLEKWRNTALDPEARAALDGLHPALVWHQVQDLVFQAFDLYPDQAQKLMDNYQPPYDQESLDLMMQNLNPVVGINNFQAVNMDSKLNLKDLTKSQSVDVLDKVLFMVTLSDKWPSEVAT